MVITSLDIPIVILSVVDHTVRLKPNNRSNSQCKALEPIWVDATLNNLTATCGSP